MVQWQRYGMKVRLWASTVECGFLTNEAVILGVESRSSSAVRLPRDPETLQSIFTPHLYPCGEGAGYAGGITSSALDGINVALKIVESMVQ